MPIFRRRRPSPEDVALAEELEARGFFRGLDPQEAASAKAAIAKHGIDVIWRVDIARHVVSADPEDLAEGGVADWLAELRPTLERLGVRLDEDVEQDFGEELYVVRVGGREHVIYDLAGADAAAAENGALLWELSWSRTFTLLNDLLERAGASERAYAVSESIWFLTPELVELLPTEFGGASGT